MNHNHNTDENQSEKVKSSFKASRDPTPKTKKKLLNYYKIGKSIATMQKTLDIMLSTLLEKVVKPLAEKTKEPGSDSMGILKDGKWMMAYLKVITDILYKSTKMFMLLEQNWHPENRYAHVPPIQFLNEAVRHMIDSGKLDPYGTQTAGAR